MTADLLAIVPSRPDLPEPRRERWQPLRMGLIELFHYDSEEFWFHDGHLLLRGNNGTGKSKVLSLTLPLLFDAQLRSSRVEPDGDPGKKMAWNLLLDSYPRRIGYSWIEFGRRERDGRARYLTLGAGLSAVAGRAQVDNWYFLMEGDGTAADPRLGQDVWLTTADRQVLTRERLREVLAGRGQLFESNAQAYRRAVDERLFHLGTRRYDALMDTLIQLRQPQLSKKPDESGLSHALSESLPPLPSELLGDVAEALNQLEEDRNRLEETRRLEQVVAQFEQRYRVYAGMQARRQARELRQAQTGFDNASEARNRIQSDLERWQGAERDAAGQLEAAKQDYSIAREQVETLQSDPDNNEANRLAQAEQDAAQRRGEADAAAERCGEASGRLRREADLGQRRGRRAEEARERLAVGRIRVMGEAARVGVETDVAVNPLHALTVDALAGPLAAPREAGEALRALVVRRRRDIAHLRQCHAEIMRCQTLLTGAREHAQAARTDLDDALERRERADRGAEQAGQALVEAWSRHCAGLVQLGFDADEALRRLVDWTLRPEGENPALGALSVAWQAALRRYAMRQAELDARRDSLHGQRAELEAERARLVAGEDTVPPEQATRSGAARAQRSGAPLWRLVDFSPALGAAERAGLEAALEAGGLLDAWLSPDGSLLDGRGQPWLDASWVERPSVAGTSLGDALIVTLPDSCPVTAATVAGFLGSVAYGPEDSPDAETWFSPDGRYRLGTLAGAWRKAEARYIGHGAREHARRRRLQDIAEALAGLDAERGECDRQATELDAFRRRAEQEWQGAPSDRPLHDAIAAAMQAGREAGQARQRLELADGRCRDAEARVHEARERVRHDATDLRLPAEESGLSSVEQALESFDQAQSELVQAVHEWQRAWPEHLEQQQREGEARAMLEQAEAALTRAKALAEQARIRFEALHQSIGQQVEDLRRRLMAALAERGRAEQVVEHCRALFSEAQKAHVVAATHMEQAERTLAERGAARLEATERLRRFSLSGLLASALPGLELPEHWSVDPALNLARRIEQALTRIADDDAARTRAQRQVAEDLNDLQRALTALGQQAISEPNDWGITVVIQYQNRAERPDRLAQLLADDIAQRGELLSAREREVLENHLQAEIASEIQRLIRAADDRVTAINDELYRRPTSTGVRYRLQWEPLSVEDGAPVGLEEARKRLLNTSPDLWSAEDRATVGVMLQRQIAAERANAESAAASGSLIDQLARALDYRHWHRFRILRQQDGQWRRLSGPASSGERALGLTVPLFAAIASFYGHGGNPLAPRLMLLDEAFAGIDDNARAHCMGLVREFDLDFVMTSEREWACYAELPGVAICQLQRREGIDAVFVSRWVWDGRARRLEDDPDRRFPAA
ncbi:TIGR02680 family protein [Gluconacetobacter sp. Hr-1-5]|uniref:TIGR02680 family protein n=1 Tax=Gluconacetobacter sp. Hr-1-5 TaxID=3395370 RepID=UPI003B52ADE3